MPSIGCSETFTDEVSDIGELLDLAAQRPSWHRLAACRTAPAGVSWFPELGQPAQPAKTVCAGCLAREDCLAWALGQGPELAGVWGGTTPKERRTLRGAYAA